MRTLMPLLVAALLTLPAMACSGGSGTPTAIEIPIDSLAFTSTCPPLHPQSSCQLTVEAFTAEGQRIANPVLRWDTFNSAVATVNDEGLVTAKEDGTTTIQVSNSTGTVSARTGVRVLPTNDNEK